MKKIYSLALVAMMALCAMVVASCGSDDEEVTPASTTFEFAISYSNVSATNGADEQAKTAIRSYFSQKLKAIDGVTFSDDIIKGSSKIKDQVVAALQVTDYDALDENLKEITNLKAITFEINNAHNTKEVIVASHTYEKKTPAIEPSLMIGTWKTSTSDGDYTLTVTSETTKGDISSYTYYVCSAAGPDGVSHAGVMWVTDHGTGEFNTNEKNSKNLSLIWIKNSGYTDDNHTTFRGSLSTEGTGHGSNLTFTKQ